MRGTKREEVERGQVIVKPGSITPHTEFEANVYILSKDEGGRHTPFFDNYRPQFYFRTTDVTGVVHLPEGTEMVMPGDNTEMRVDLIQPIAMEEGLRFAIREGGRTVGAGRVTKISSRSPSARSGRGSVAPAAEGRRMSTPTPRPLTARGRSGRATRRIGEKPPGRLANCSGCSAGAEPCAAA